MNFLAFVIALALRQLWGAEVWLHRDHWWQDWRQRAIGLGLLPWVQMVLTVGLPLLLALLVLDLLRPVLFGLPWIVAAALVLLYAFGRGDFHARIARYRDFCERDNSEGAWLYLREELHAGDPQEVDPGLEPEQLHDQLQASLYYDDFQRWFAVVFWFVLLGPVAALGYRLLQLYREAEGGEGPAVIVLFLLDWVPLRLLLVTFTLAGDFVRSRDELVAALVDPWADSQGLLLAVGSAAAGAGPETSASRQAAAEVTALAGLMTRSGVVWVVLIAVLAIFA
ncbi:regulatory signaling modulator protein AmpE [Haliea sp. E1-2-M8]|uniref:regulatory signaling modulator protein AmpE n=1 Tax=Haliea sp. E1-2-M8 TaxID=3064706 RepID=UPI002725AA3E|nr:regulatory signaling modulator protein AmpE [Haliea sp. E1-2-M8]MDO8861423.1 regulatory signaling modulator protein AmpE [Haliea sp. E1-2-M8]